jgi:hypothetical protein
MSATVDLSHLTAACVCVSLCAVNRIALVKPEKARAVENLIINMAQRGQLMEKVRLMAYVIASYMHIICVDS